MAKDGKEVWVLGGYEVFALSGPAGLKIEPLSRKVGIGKSSFYHHFADQESFVDQLLKYHIGQSHIIAVKERNALNVDPDLIHVLVEHKMDLLFNRQLRINQNIQPFADCLGKSNKIVGDAFVTVWARDLSQPLSQKQMESVFALALENFFLQINADNLCYEWLATYFYKLKEITRNLV